MPTGPVSPERLARPPQAYGRRDELTAAGDLGRTAVGAATGEIRSAHQAVARRVFGLLGVGAKPVELVHDAVVELSYASVRLAAGAGVRGGAQLLAALAPADAPTLHEGQAAHRVLALLSAITGDRLERSGSPLAVSMSLRDPRGRAIGLSTAELRRVYPQAGDRLLVFVHGLGGSEESWRPRRSERGSLAAGETVAPSDRLTERLQGTALYLRYNTGRHISENGEALAELLDEVVANWPMAVREVVLIGHAMGGLVCRSACHNGAGAAWSELVSHVVTLGSPHLGLPVERAASLLQRALEWLPETRAAGRALAARSAGARDLGAGHVLEEHWLERRPGALVPDAQEMPPLSRARHLFLSGSPVPVSIRGPRLVRRLTEGIVAGIGDGVVPRRSAWDRRPGEGFRFGLESYCELAPLTHRQLPRHPAVHEQIHRFITSSRALPAPG